MLSLTSTHQYRGETTILSTVLSASEILQALHDPGFLININPEVKSAAVDRRDNATWSIIFQLSFLGLVPMSVTGTARFTPVIDGMDVETTAGAGTKTMSKWRLHTADASGNMRVTEEGTVETCFVFGPYVWKTFRSVHDELLQSLPKEIEKRRSAQPSGL